jgi:hypothetical protein
MNIVNSLRDTTEILFQFLGVFVIKNYELAYIL